MQNVSEIKALLSAAEGNQLLDFINQFEIDERSGVQKMVESARKKYQAFLKECERVEAMRFFEKKYENYKYICGIDEVGRGPLAGPVVAAAVILPKDCSILYVNDSKQLSAAKREELYDVIMEQAIAVGVGMATHTRIDEINILQATYEAMQSAVSKLSVVPDLLLNDAVTIPKLTMKQVPIIHGDAKSISIAAASIVAKVTRDRMMDELADIYPEYDFKSNKGYGSAKHLEALQTIGPCPIHRRSFIKKYC